MLAAPAQAQMQQLPAGHSTIAQLLNIPIHPYYNRTITQYEQNSLQSLYRLNLNQLVWFNTEHPVAQINQLLTHFSQASRDGLNSHDYSTELLSEHWYKLQHSNPSFYEFAVFDTALSLNLLRYLHDLHDGRVNPKQLNFDLPAKKRINFATPIYHALKTQTLPALLAEFEPKLAPYQYLKKALAKYHRLNQYFTKPVFFQFEKSLHPGDRSSQISLLEHYLNALNTDVQHAIPSIQTTQTLYTESMANKIRKLQIAHGLQGDGIIGKQTLAVLNTPLSQRITQIELAMERLRWLPDSYQGAIIFVNIPAFQLWAYHSTTQPAPSLTMRVIVGKAKAKEAEPDMETRLQTPIFTEKLNYLVFSPYWNIPKSILIKEILPLLEQNPEYLAQHHMEIVARFTHNATPIPATPENIARLSTGELKLRQRPNSRNALGRIKFIFPNDYKVYLHDTPARGLFQRAQRDLSHGCIRVANPEALADFVLSTQAQWDSKAIKTAMHADTPIIASVKQKIPVLIFYTTALANKAGVSFYPDIYTYDPPLQAALTTRSQYLANSVLPTTHTTRINMHKIGAAIQAHPSPR